MGNGAAGGGAARYDRSPPEWELGGDGRRLRPKGLRFWLAAASGVYLLALAAVWAANAAGAERFWWATLNMYLPQWLWGVPAAVLGPLAWRHHRKLIWVPVAGAVWVAGPMA